MKVCQDVPWMQGFNSRFLIIYCAQVGGTCDVCEKQGISMLMLSKDFV